MELREDEQKAGMMWFFGAGIFAVALCVFLYSVDQGLSTSKREQHLAEALRELRMAQTTLQSRSTDERQTLAVATGVVGADETQPPERHEESHDHH